MIVFDTVRRYFEYKGYEVKFVSNFKEQFREKKTEKFTYTKTGAKEEGEIDALSGATITTNAMTNGVNAGLCAFQYVKGGAFK